MTQGHDKVNFVETEPVSCLRMHNDAFSLQPLMGYIWLQRVCFWILRWIGAFHATDWTTFRRVTVDRKTSLAELFRQQLHLRGQFREGGELLLVGSEDWMEILNEAPLWHSPMAFDGEYYISTLPSYDGTPRQQKNRMRVCVLPWMRGMVVVPGSALH